MHVQYTFRLRGNLYVDQSLVYQKGNWVYRFHGSGTFASAISVTIKDVPQEYWPEVASNPQPGVRAHINLRDPHGPFIIHDVLNIASLLGPFGVHDVETDSVKIGWVPQSKEEAAALPITNSERSFSSPSPNPEGPLPPDLIARCIIGARQSDENQIPLSFFRRGMEDIHNRRYIEAFYDFYFIFETLFANGKTDTKKVLKEYLSSGEFCRNAEILFSDPRVESCLKHIDARKFTQVIGPKDKETLFKYLILTRGKLHHHHMKQSQKTLKWDPKNQKDYYFEAALANELAFLVCMRRVKEQLWADDIDLSRIRVQKLCKSG